MTLAIKVALNPNTTNNNQQPKMEVLSLADQKAQFNYSVVNKLNGFNGNRWVFFDTN